MNLPFSQNSWETHYFGMFVFFPILFPYYGNSLFPCFANCMDFCIKRKTSETLNFEIFVVVNIYVRDKVLKKKNVFSHICPYYANSLFPYFGNSMDFCFNQNIWETLESLLFFPYFSCIMRIHFSHVLRVVWVSASSKMFLENFPWNRVVRNI